MPNLYGDILSDVAAQIAGSVGLAGSANIGDQAAMFEAIHGSAPRRAGQNLANPSGLLLGAVMMLVHIGQPDVATRVHNAWLTTLEDGIHTYDVHEEGVSKEKVGTREFARAVAERLGRTPAKLKAVAYAPAGAVAARTPVTPETVEARMELQGVDVYVIWESRDSDALAARMQPLAGPEFSLKMMTSRGVKVWPDGQSETYRGDQFRCRLLAADGRKVSYGDVVSVLGRIAQAGMIFAKTENLHSFDGERGYSLGQGE